MPGVHRGQELLQCRCAVSTSHTCGDGWLGDACWTAFFPKQAFWTVKPATGIGNLWSSALRWRLLTNFRREF